MSKTVLITGASRGIGQVIAARLRDEGYRVYGTSRNPTPESDLLQLDVTDDDSVTACIAQVLAATGTIDILINNAGYSIFGAVEETSVVEAKALFEINFFGVLRVCNAVLPIMRQQGSGLIINMSSLAGVFGVPYLGMYSTTKWALEAYSEALRYEVKAFGIDVVLVQPDDIHTDLYEPDTAKLIDDYAPVRAVVKADHTHSMDTAPPPSIVADTVLHVISKTRPAIRYPVGNHWYLNWLKRALPASIFEAIIRKSYKLNN